jgi:hypothetical protein
MALLLYAFDYLVSCYFRVWSTHTKNEGLGLYKFLSNGALNKQTHGSRKEIGFDKVLDQRLISTVHAAFKKLEEKWIFPFLYSASFLFSEFTKQRRGLAGDKNMLFTINHYKRVFFYASFL